MIPVWRLITTFREKVAKYSFFRPKGEDDMMPTFGFSEDVEQYSEEDREYVFSNCPAL